MNLKKLNRGPRDNRFCGPAVISFITGLNTTDAAYLIRKHYGGGAVRGTTSGEISGILAECGYALRPSIWFRKKERPTLAGWLKDTVKDRIAGRVFLVDAWNHWQLVTGRRYACGWVGEIVSIKDKRVKRRARVHAVWEVVEVDTTRLKAVKAQIAKERKLERMEYSTRSSARSRVIRLAEKHKIEVEVDDYGRGQVTIYMSPPEWVSDAREDGKVNYNSYAYDWTEAEGNVEDIIAAMAELQKETA